MPRLENRRALSSKHGMSTRILVLTPAIRFENLLRARPCRWRDRMRVNGFCQCSPRPRFPAFSDRFCVPFYVNLFQLLDAVSHKILRFVARRFEQWPQKRQRKNAPVDFSPWRLPLDFPFALVGSGVADGQANGNSKAECAENRWYRIFAHEILGTLECPARLVFRLVPLMANLRGNLFCCSTKLL